MSTFAEVFAELCLAHGRIVKPGAISAVHQLAPDILHPMSYVLGYQASIQAWDLKLAARSQ